MLKIYCSKCGGLNTYVSEKPNFCHKCGSPMNATTAKAQAQAKQQQLQIEDDDEDETQNLFDLDGLDFEFEAGKSNTETLGNIAGSVSEEQAQNSSEDIPVPKNQKYTAEDFRAEAGNIRGDGGGNEAGST